MPCIAHQKAQESHMWLQNIPGPVLPPKKPKRATCGYKLFHALYCFPKSPREPHVATKYSMPCIAPQKAQESHMWLQNIPCPVLPPKKPKRATCGYILVHALYCPQKMPKRATCGYKLVHSLYCPQKTPSKPHVATNWSMPCIASQKSPREPHVATNWFMPCIAPKKAQESHMWLHTIPCPVLPQKKTKIATCGYILVHALYCPQKSPREPHVATY